MFPVDTREKGKNKTKIKVKNLKMIMTMKIIGQQIHFPQLKKKKNLTIGLVMVEANTGG